MHGTLEHRSTMMIMDQTGHTEISWGRHSEAEIEIARASFNAAVGRGYSAFKVERGGGRGERVTKFDPEAEKYILAPQLAGG